MLDLLLNSFRLVTGAAAALIMGAFVVAGLVELGHALVLQSQVLAGRELADDVHPVATALCGLEMLFLSPLAYLALTSLYRYVASSRDSGRVDPRDAVAALHAVKAQIVGLIIAVVATETLRRLLVQDDLTYPFAILAIGLILALALYARWLDHPQRPTNVASA